MTSPNPPSLRPEKPGIITQLVKACVRAILTEQNGAFSSIVDILFMLRESGGKDAASKV